MRLTLRNRPSPPRDMATAESPACPRRPSGRGRRRLPIQANAGRPRALDPASWPPASPRPTVRRGLSIEPAPRLAMASAAGAGWDAPALCPELFCAASCRPWSRREPRRPSLRMPVAVGKAVLSTLSPSAPPHPPPFPPTLLPHPLPFSLSNLLSLSLSLSLSLARSLSLTHTHTRLACLIYHMSTVVLLTRQNQSLHH